MQQQSSEQSIDKGPPIIISLDYYLNLACRGFENVATVSSAFGKYINQTVDPNEQHTHVEFSIGPNNLAQIYPIQTWRETVIRRERVKAQAEVDRQARFIEQEHALLIREALIHKRELLAAEIARIRRNYPKTVAIDYDIVEHNVFKALCGNNKPIAERFLITQESIDEFFKLPIDPEFKNKHWLLEQEMLKGR